MEIIKTIIPIFAVVFLGFLAKRKNILTDDFLSPANRLTYFITIPALIFQVVAKSDFSSQFNGVLLAGTLLPLIVVYLVAWFVCSIAKVDKRQRGTLIESTMHGNAGYVGLAVVYYHLGQTALATAAILASFMFMLHNVLAVVVLQVYSDKDQTKGGLEQIVLKIISNPIILSSIISILFSLSHLKLPVIIDRTISILSNLSLPLALLVIGASLSFKIQSRQLIQIVCVCGAKLIFLPAVGYCFFSFFSLPDEVFLPGLILLSSPVAFVVYIFAVELKGDTALAVNIVSVSIAVSFFTISFWLKLTL